MSYWFDDLTKQLALGSLSRREALRAVVTACCAASASALFGNARLLAAQPLLPQSPERPTIPGLPRPPLSSIPCSNTVSGQEQVVTFHSQITLSGRIGSLDRTLTKTLGLRGGSSSLTRVVYAGQILIDASASGSRIGLAPPTTGVTVRFGEGITGIREMTLSTTDGKTLRGVIDGRPILPFTIGADVSTLKFQDGKPAPLVGTKPGISVALQSIFKRAGEDAKLCSSSPRSLAAAVALTPLTDPPDTGRSDDTNSTEGCKNCTAGCVVTVTGATAACCIGTFGLACGICIAVSTVADPACIDACHFTGAPCCPVSCGNVACCFGGDTCLDTSRGVCCAPGTNPCNGRQCCQATDRCLPDGTCCPQGQAICNNVCCQPGQACSTESVCCQQFQSNVSPISCRGTCCAADEVCKDGVACCPPNDPICNGVCCRGGSCDSHGACCSLQSNGGKLCGGICCPVFSTCCGSVCCGGSAQCVNGTCCPTVQVCGGICCPAGQSCQNASKQQCGACASGLVPCAPINSSTPVCCPPGASCCAGQCCPSGQICCDVGGVFGCHTEQVCIP